MVAGRALALGLGASVVLHAVVGLWLSRAPQPPLLTPGVGGVETIEVQVVPAPAPGARRESPPVAAPRTRRAAAALVEVGPAPSVEVAEEGEGGGPSPGPAGDSPGVESGGGTGSGGPPPATALLMARLSAAALRCYPAEAVRFRLAGEAHLSFCLGAEGQASAVKLSRSSGSEVLDRAAAECVLPGALPLSGAAGCYELPVRFSARRP